MDINLLLSFLGASILLTFMPGPDILLVITESISRGKKFGISLAIGLVSGVSVHTLIAATGLSILLVSSEELFNAVKLLGAFYLFYLTYQAMREKVNIQITEKASRSDYLKLMKQGFIMNVSNPKVTLFFIAFLPQFVSPTGLNSSIQMIILGLIFMAQAIILFSFIAFLAGKMNTLLQSQSFWRIAKWSKAFILFSLGLALLIS